MTSNVHLDRKIKAAIGDMTSIVADFGALPDVLGGGMHINSARLWATLLALQSSRGVLGDVCEVGVFRGHGSLIPTSTLTDQEVAVLVDISEPFLDEAKALLLKYTHTDPSSLTLICGTSDDLAEQRSHSGGQLQFRWAHIDAEHSKEAVVQDLTNLKPLMCRDGIIVIDDYELPLSPCVRDGVGVWLVLNTDWRLLVQGFNKAYLVHWQSSVPYDSVVERLPDVFEHFFDTRISTASQTRSTRTPYWSYGPSPNGDPYAVVGAMTKSWAQMAGVNPMHILLGAPERPVFLLVGGLQMAVLTNAMNAVAEAFDLCARFRYLEGGPASGDSDLNSLQALGREAFGILVATSSDGQMPWSAQVLRKSLADDVFIGVPVLETRGYWPNHATLQMANDNSGVELIDAILYLCVSHGWTDSAIINLVTKPSLYTRNEIREWWDICLPQGGDVCAPETLTLTLRELLSKAPAGNADRQFFIMNHPRKSIFDELARALLPELNRYLGFGNQGKLDRFLRGIDKLDYSTALTDFVDIPPLPSVSIALELDERWRSDCFRRSRRQGSDVPHAWISTTEELRQIRNKIDQLSPEIVARNLSQISNQCLLPQAVRHLVDQDSAVHHHKEEKSSGLRETST